MHDIVSVWQRLFFPIYFSIQFIFLLFIGPITLFGTIHRLHCIISANFLVNLLFSRLGVQSLPFGFVLFKTPSFLPPFSLKWFVLGISYRVLFVLISIVWRPLFIFLHLYLGPCSRDIGIYFPILCASIVHDVCIYILACPFLV